MDVMKELSWYRHGHAPGHLRDAFTGYVEENGMKPGNAIIGDDEERVSITQLTGKLWDCTDIMPSEICDELDLPQGSTYAQGARALKAKISRVGGAKASRFQWLTTATREAALIFSITFYPN